ncbi:MAG: DinB family protein [Flavobacteriaceae bacterium]|nr:MAG: DinB family protein [Flavobacteriaceae bacterium]
MKSIFEEATYKEVIERFNRLSPESVGLWGKMSVGQMLWHCQVFVKAAVKNKKYDKRGNPIIRWFFKKSMYNDKPWRKNLPTTPFARAKEEKDFEAEHKKLLELVKELYSLRARKTWNAHPIFGDFTPEQWGQLEYKHLDHHLRQFGV